MEVKEGAVEQVISNHESSGRFITVDGIKTFILEKGEGEPVLCLHGVPTSSFLYRKVISSLSELGYQGISFDFPGLGLSERPENFNYSFTGFSDFTLKVVEQLGLKDFHLVVHDIGGPIGFAFAAKNPDKIKSLTILNTWVDVENFKKPLPMRPFEKPVLGETELALMKHFTWKVMFQTLGVEDSSQISDAEIYAYVDLLKREDGGKAFLKIMRNFDNSADFKNLCYTAVKNVPYRVQAIWGVNDPGLTYNRYGEEIKKVAGLKEIIKLPARHLLQEENWKEIASKIARLTD